LKANINKKVALVTGSAGFIGFHVSKCLLDNDWRVIGVDCMSNYYEVSLKTSRENILLQNPGYKSVHSQIEEPNLLRRIFEEENPNVVIHLAAQAGVRYSIENPRSYLESNIIGTFELLEAARAYPPEHILIASTSSAYGANSSETNYKETDKADEQISFYAATKKSTENIAHSYAHLFNLQITMFRFFTVYGPWGRPDMALFKFTKAILEGNQIDVYNFGEMSRDFTFIDDLVHAINLLIDVQPKMANSLYHKEISYDSKSSVAPFRVVNIGNANPVKLIDFIGVLEDALDISAKKNFLDMQPGDVPATWASIDLLKSLTGYEPKTDITTGIPQFVDWYRSYYQI
jgi:UDP-glucuronate 4-epimerase